jgi:formylglycine-generating enzyme required for sulfatase activity
MLLASGCGSDAAGEAEAGLERNCPLAKADVVLVRGGSFGMGDDHRYPEEGSARALTVDSFWIDVHEVTNAQFSAIAFTAMRRIGGWSPSTAAAWRPPIGSAADPCRR